MKLFSQRTEDGKQIGLFFCPSINVPISADDPQLPKAGLPLIGDAFDRLEVGESKQFTGHTVLVRIQ